MKKLLLAGVMLVAANSYSHAQQEATPWDTGHDITCSGKLQMNNQMGLMIANEQYSCHPVDLNKASNKFGQQCAIGDDCHITDRLAVAWYYYRSEGAGQPSTCTGHAMIVKGLSENRRAVQLIAPDKSMCFFFEGAVSFQDANGQQCRFGIDGYNIYWPMCIGTGYLYQTMYLLGKGWVASPK
jgi:hypothetical protein